MIIKNQIVVINSEHIDFLKITLLLNHIYIGEIMTGGLITKFRISSHQLEIERGRYRNIPASQRICKLCNLEVEDELHFLLECPKSNKIRKEILEQLENKFNNLKSLDYTSKFVWLLSAHDILTLQRTIGLVLTHSSFH